MKTTNTISFIGAGFSANSILFHLERLLYSQSQSDYNNYKLIINLFDKRNIFGDGISYKVYHSDIIILSTGNNEQEEVLDIEKSSKYISNFDKINDLANRSDNSNILIIGTSLSAVDVILMLYHKKFQGQIYCYSRNLLLPKIRLPYAKKKLKFINELLTLPEISLIKLARYLNREFGRDYLNILKNYS
jgi:uncharacterized NAD(P)/FAD-binding protein YdhS